MQALREPSGILKVFDTVRIGEERHQQDRLVLQQQWQGAVMKVRLVGTGLHQTGQESLAGN